MSDGFICSESSSFLATLFHLPTSTISSALEELGRRMGKGLLFLLVGLLPSITFAADFIESVHSQGADIAKEMVVEGSQVVWSPFSVVNVLPLINGDDSLKTGFKSAITHLKEVGGIQISRLTTAFVKDKSKMESLGLEYGVTVEDFPTEENVKEILNEKYKDELGVEAPPGLFPEALGNTTQLFLTSLLVKAEWETPFKYAAKAKFFLNETHAVKARYMSNIGFYSSGEVPGIDATILAIPLKNSSTTSVLVVLPKNSSALALVSRQFADVHVGNILEKLTKKRTQLTVPKITVESQLLLQPMPTVKIIQSGSIRFSYFGLDNRVYKLRRTTNKFQRTRAQTKDFKFTVNRPFIYLIFDTKGGVLNYGEVLLPIDHSYTHLNFKTDADRPLKLSQNAKSLAEANHDRGNLLFQNLRSKLSTFAFSPITLANVLAAYATVADPTTQELLFSTLNSKAGMVELYEGIAYVNATSSNRTRIVGGNAALTEKVRELGTEVDTAESKTTEGCTEYNYEVLIRATKKYVRTFYRNERDSKNVTFYEHIGHIKYIGLPFWDARAILLFLSPSQSLLIFVPNERSGLHVVEDGLKDFAVSKLLCQMRDRHARVRLPVFNVTGEMDLLPSLKEVLGVEEIQIEGLGLPIHNLTHKTKVCFNGERESSKSFRYSYNKYNVQRRRPSTRVNVDRPFVFYLLDKIGGTLAIGRVTDVPGEDEVAPSQEEIVDPPSSLPPK